MAFMGFDRNGYRQLPWEIRRLSEPYHPQPNSKYPKFWNAAMARSEDPYKKMWDPRAYYYRDPDRLVPLVPQGVIAGKDPVEHSRSGYHEEASQHRQSHSGYSEQRFAPENNYYPNASLEYARAVEAEARAIADLDKAIETFTRLYAEYECMMERMMKAMEG